MELVSKALPGGIMGGYPPDQKWVEESIEQQFRERNEYKVEYRMVGKDGRIYLGQRYRKKDKGRRRKRCHDQYHYGCL